MNYVVRVTSGPSLWTCLVVGVKGINLVSSMVITLLFMALQNVNTTKSAHLQ